MKIKIIEQEINEEYNRSLFNASPFGTALCDMIGIETTKIIVNFGVIINTQIIASLLLQCLDTSKWLLKTVSSVILNSRLTFRLKLCTKNTILNIE